VPITTINTLVLYIRQLPVMQLTYDILISIIYFLADAHNTFNLFDKKGNGQVSTKELGNIFKSLALQIPADRLKEWADEVDEEGMYYHV